MKMIMSSTVQSESVTVPVKKTAPKTVTKSVLKVGPKTATKQVVDPAPKAPVKAEPKAALVPAVKPKSEKLLKAKKPKLVRDSFTIPKLEYLILEELKQRGGKLGSSVKKSELIRAGIKALAAMPDANLLAALKAVPAIKTGRPSKN